MEMRGHMDANCIIFFGKWAVIVTISLIHKDGLCFRKTFSSIHFLFLIFLVKHMLIARTATDP